MEFFFCTSLSVVKNLHFYSAHVKIPHSDVAAGTQTSISSGLLLAASPNLT